MTQQYKKLKVTLRKTTDKTYVRDLLFDIRDNSLSQKWAKALHEDYLDKRKYPNIEKQFMLHGWPYLSETSNQRQVEFMCEELNFHIHVVNEYARKKGIPYKIDMHFDEATLTQEQLNEIHHHFEVLIGQIWNVSNYYPMFDEYHQWSINNFNWLCHEIESQLRGLKAYNDDRSSSSIVVCMDPIIRHDMSESEGDYDFFQMEDLIFGQVRMHYAQTGKTHREAYHDNDEDIYDSNISGIRYISGEFDVHLNIPHPSHSSEKDWASFRQWLRSKDVDLNDKTLALGWCVLADFDRYTWGDKTDLEIMQELWQCDDLVCIELHDHTGMPLVSKKWTYTWQDRYFQTKQALLDSIEEENRYLDL